MAIKLWYFYFKRVMRTLTIISEAVSSRNSVKLQGKSKGIKFDSFKH